jgi:hypothetical protein
MAQIIGTGKGLAQVLFMLTGFLVMLWSAIHSGDAPMNCPYRTPLYLKLAEIALLASVLVAPVIYMVVAP